jgi:hypothetical protein
VKKKDLHVILFLILAAAVLLKGTHIRSVEEYYRTHIDDITPESETVFISIRCNTVLNNRDKLNPALQSDEFVPPDGVILQKSEYVLREGDTAFDMLERAVRANRIQMEYQGGNLNVYNSVYVQGINYLYEFSCGPLSGWMYLVNGVFPNYGSSKYTLCDGDTVEWVYTCDLGCDVGCEWMEGG